MSSQSDAYQQGVEAALTHVSTKTFENWANEPTSSIAKVLVETASAIKPEEVCKAQGHSVGTADADFVNGVRYGLRDLLSMHVS